LPDGTSWPPVSLAVGFIFVLRDFAQREIGHWVLLAMLAGAVLSYFMAGPDVALASLAAFAVSELVDWAVYSFTRRPLSQRILLSSVLGTPVDSAVFLGGIGLLSVAGTVTMTASKMLGALCVWWLIRRRELGA
ncbi:MAG: VUT family protein, partial [Alphaproteobacteria bacterium]